MSVRVPLPVVDIDLRDDIRARALTRRHPTQVPLDLLLDAYRLLGIRDEQLIVHPGAETLAARRYTSAGFYRGVQAIVNHHTAESPGTRPVDSVRFLISGHGDGFVVAATYADSPLASGLAFARLWILALGGGTYTEGRGGPRGLIPADGANLVALSREIANDGTGRVHYPTSQQDLVARATAAEAWLMSLLYEWHDDPIGPDRTFSHAEWAPGRKGDPAGDDDPAGPFGWQDGTGATFHGTRTWNEDRLRADCRTLIDTVESATREATMIRYHGDTRVTLDLIARADGTIGAYEFGGDLPELAPFAAATWRVAVVGFDRADDVGAFGAWLTHQRSNDPNDWRGDLTTPFYFGSVGDGANVTLPLVEHSEQNPTRRVHRVSARGCRRVTLHFDLIGLWPT